MNVNPSGNGLNGEVYDSSEISPCVSTNDGKGIKIAGMLDMKGTEQIRRVYEKGGVAPTLTTMQGGWQEPKTIERFFPDPVVAASRGRNEEKPSSRKVGEDVKQRLEINKLGTSNALTSVQKDNYVMIPTATACGYEVDHDGDSINLTMPKSKTRRGRCGDAVAQTLDTQCNQGVLFMEGSWWWVRKLTPRECFRLQDFTDDFKIVVSDTQAYMQAGNSMSVNVIEMIFRQIKKSQEGVKPEGRLF